MIYNLDHIFRNFSTKETISSITPYGTGHINDTFLVKTDAQKFDYILQRINHKIFTDVPGLMENISLVTDHLKKKLKNLPAHDPFTETLNLVRTHDEKPFFQDDQGNFWRVFLFIPGMKIFENAVDQEMAREAGRIIGFFQNLLTDLEHPVKDTLPGFHSIHRRSSEYHVALVKDPKNRTRWIKDDIFFVDDRLNLMKEYYNSFEEKGLPRRIVHYDTKLNNILFDENNKATCLIDLDTLCPGYVHFDYGDALRTLANTAAEDEQDPGKVKFNIPFYHSFTEGYLAEANRFLSAEEKQMLPFAPVYLTFLIGLRFLSDYLNGDVYYKIKFPEHNLVRARVQFQLVRQMSMSIELRA